MAERRSLQLARRSRPALARSGATRPELIDTIAGVVIAGAALVQIASDLNGVLSTCVTLAVIAGLAGGLRWRRLHPLLLALAAITIVLVGDLLGGRGTQPVAALMAYLLIVYSVGAHAPRRPAVLGLLALTAGLFVDNAIGPNAGTFSGVGDAVYPLMTCIPAWSVGRVLRARRAMSRRLADRVAELESEREQLTRLAVGAERARIARELHDVVAHCVSLIVIQAAAGQRVVEGDAAAATRILDAILEAGDQALHELTQMVGLLDGLAPGAAASEPGLERLGELILRAEQAGMRVTLNVEGVQTLTPAIDAASFRIVQEALTNAVKHAGPGNVTVTVLRGQDQLELEIADEGPDVSRAPAQFRGGHGLQGMRERVELLGGTLDAGPGEPRGWTLRASLPLANDRRPPAMAGNPAQA